MRRAEVGKLLSLEERARHGQGRMRTAQDTLLPPPYQLENAHLIGIGGMLDPSAVSALLPPDLEPVEGCFGGITLYTVGSGGLGRYTGFFAFIEVEGYPSPSGMNARYPVLGYYSALGFEFMSRAHKRMEPGLSTIETAGPLITGTSGPSSAPTISAKFRLADPEGPPTTTYGSNAYVLEPTEGGGRNILPVPYVLRHYEVVDPTIELTSAADPRLRPFAEMNIAWGAWTPDTAFTIGEPKPIESPVHEISAGHARTALLSAFSHIGRAVALVSRDGQIIKLNERARELLGRGIEDRHGRLRASVASDQRKLEQALGAASDSTALQSSAAYVALSRPSETRPLLVQALPTDSAIGEDISILLFSDPNVPDSGDPLPALMLLGLTPAEARTAALVGHGLSTREAAEELGNTEGTVRVTLKQVYDKLGLARATELASLLSRLTPASITEATEIR